MLQSNALLPNTDHKASLQTSRDNHLIIFIYKALLLKLPKHLICSHMFILMFGRSGFRYAALLKWNELQTAFKLESFTPLGDFEALLPVFL